MLSVSIQSDFKVENMRKGNSSQKLHKVRNTGKQDCPCFSSSSSFEKAKSDWNLPRFIYLMTVEAAVLA